MAEDMNKTNETIEKSPIPSSLLVPTHIAVAKLDSNFNDMKNMIYSDLPSSMREFREIVEKSKKEDATDRARPSRQINFNKSAPDGFNFRHLTTNS